MDGKDCPRYQMWCELIPLYSFMKTDEKKSAKKAYAKERGLMPHEITNVTALEIMNRFDSLKQGVCCNTTAMTVPVPCAPKKGNNMFYDDDDMDDMPHAATPEATQRHYLKSRMWNVEEAKRGEAHNLFNMGSMPQPKTPKELAERLAKGLYVIENANDPEAGNKEIPWHQSATDRIIWRDPAKTADKAGYAAWTDKLGTAVKETLDLITIRTPEEGLAALQEFEKFPVA